MTPFEAEILIHYFVTPRPHRVESENPPIWPETLAWFLKEQLLEVRGPDDREYGGTYRTTKRGEVWITAALNTPLPVWAVPTVREDSNG